MFEFTKERVVAGANKQINNQTFRPTKQKKQHTKQTNKQTNKTEETMGVDWDEAGGGGGVTQVEQTVQTLTCWSRVATARLPLVRWKAFTGRRSHQQLSAFPRFWGAALYQPAPPAVNSEHSPLSPIFRSSSKNQNEGRPSGTMCSKSQDLPLSFSETLLHFSPSNLWFRSKIGTSLPPPSNTN